MRADTENYPVSYLMCVLYRFVVIVLATVFLLLPVLLIRSRRKVERRLSTNSPTGGACVLRRGPDLAINSNNKLAPLNYRI
jgi:hypothetical protein